MMILRYTGHHIHIIDASGVFTANVYVLVTYWSMATLYYDDPEVYWPLNPHYWRWWSAYCERVYSGCSGSWCDRSSGGKQRVPHLCVSWCAAAGYPSVHCGRDSNDRRRVSPQCASVNAPPAFACRWTTCDRRCSCGCVVEFPAGCRPLLLRQHTPAYATPPTINQSCTVWDARIPPSKQLGGG